MNKPFDTPHIATIKTNINTYLTELQIQTLTTNGPQNLTTQIATQPINNLKTTINTNKLPINHIKIVWLTSKGHHKQKPTPTQTQTQKTPTTITTQCPKCSHHFKFSTNPHNHKTQKNYTKKVCINYKIKPSKQPTLTPQKNVNKDGVSFVGTWRVKGGF